MKKQTPEQKETINQKSSTMSALYPALVAGIFGLVGAFGGAYWQAKNGTEQRIYESRVEAYNNATTRFNDENIKSLKAMRDFISASKRISTDGDVWSIDTDWSEFMQSKQGKDAIESLSSALAPVLLHGSDHAVLIGRAIMATLNDSLPQNSIRLVSAKVLTDFNHALDPSTPCYGCNEKVDRDVGARLLALRDLLTLLENRMVCDLNPESKLC
jgi:hypothetical protein